MRVTDWLKDKFNVSKNINTNTTDNYNKIRKVISQAPNTTNIEILNKYHQQETEQLHKIHSNNIKHFSRKPNLYEDTPITSVEKSFLAYMDSQSVENPQVAGYWTYEYNIDYDKVINRFLDKGYLIISNCRNLDKMKILELKDILKFFGFKVNGNKEELIKRVRDSISEEMLIDYNNDNKYFVLSEEGYKLTEKVKNSISKDLDFENQCYNLILNNNFSEAYKLICNYERAKPIPRGLGIDWNKDMTLSKSTVIHFSNFMNNNILNMPKQFNIYSKEIKACVIFGKMMGAGFDKIEWMILRVVNEDLDKKELKQIVSNLFFSL